MMIKNKIGNSISICALFLMFTFVQLSPKALADEEGGLILEPGLTYEWGAHEEDYPSPFSSSSGGSIRGFGLSGKVGLHVGEIFFLAGDGRFSRPEFRDRNNNLTATATAYNYGVVAGAQMPVFGLRAWAGYIIGAAMDPEQTGAIDLRFSGGSGYRVGAGIKLMLVSLNLEYQRITYGNLEVQKIGPFPVGTSFANSDLVNKSFVLGVSFPLTL